MGQNQRFLGAAATVRCSEKHAQSGFGAFVNEDRGRPYRQIDQEYYSVLCGIVKTL